MRLLHERKHAEHRQILSKSFKSWTTEGRVGIFQKTKTKVSWCKDQVGIHLPGFELHSEETGFLSMW